MKGSRRRLRCAAYTRKSTEEGLDQEFNTLHAQREACEAYIKSQVHEGWALSDAAYDDGGYSGGTMNRPALEQLLKDVREGRVDVIVVYKVDRLTRSLADFAKIVEILDAAGASFVSVTQAFNTTTSMGRLTLNVLLSFAQFEREVTGERIRDKISASKRRGLWMGGQLPLGYDLGNRCLVVNEKEADQVRYVFARYLELGGVPALVQDVRDKGICSKSWVPASGRRLGGRVIRRGPLYWMLRNRIYRGEIAHKGKVYPGDHAAIIDADIWDRVQTQLDTNGQRTAGSIRARSGALLAGLLYDDRGNRMTPSHARKSDGRRYRYYVSRALLDDRHQEAGAVRRVPAEPLERFVVDQLRERLQELGREHSGESEANLSMVRGRVTSVQVFPDHVVIKFRSTDESGADPTDSEHAVSIETTVARARSDAAPESDESVRRPNPALVRALALAGVWRRQIEAGGKASPAQFARAIGCSGTYAKFLARLAFLAPDLVDLCNRKGAADPFTGRITGGRNPDFVDRAEADADGRRIDHEFLRSF